MTAGRTGATHWVERGLLGIGIACLTWCGVVLVEAARWQHDQRRRMEQVVTAVPTRPAMAQPAPARPPKGSMVAELDVPRLQLSAAVIEGDDDAALRLAVGHLPDTPLPWEDGNSALAAHRDTFFRPLKDIRPGDTVRLATPVGLLEYQVRQTMIVNPEDVWVLDRTERPALTLITCYPFSYVGHAPQRFVVRAERVDSARSHRVS